MAEDRDLPLDVFVEILLRLPPSSRRRFRLVCRHWRAVIDTRTTEMQSHAKVLVFVGGSGGGGTTVSAHVVDDLSEGRCRKLWTMGTTGYSHPLHDTRMVGTCNGLLCLFDGSAMPGGAMTLVNPITGETLLVPPLSSTWPGDPTTRIPETYSFAYHPTTGRYKILHVPCNYYNRKRSIDAVDVLTLGEESWRAVPTPGATCDLKAGIINIDGTAYWVTGSDMITSFDLEDERVRSTKPMPEPRGGQPRLAEVHGRLGVTVNHRYYTEVWVLEKAGWRRRYNVVHGVWHGVSVREHLALPHFAHGDYVLTEDYKGHVGAVLYGHRLTDARLQSGVVHVTETERGTEIASIGGRVGQTFSYVETTEPLGVYKSCT